MCEIDTGHFSILQGVMVRRKPFHDNGEDRRGTLFFLKKKSYKIQGKRAAVAWTY